MLSKLTRIVLLFCGLLVFFIAFNITAQSCDYTVAAGDTTALISTIELANSNINTETICLDGGTYSITDVYETGSDGTVSLPLITTSLIVNGNNATITDSSTSDYVLENSQYITLTLNDLNIHYNRVYNQGELYYDNVQTFGGGIDNWGPIVDINNSLFDSGGIAVYYPRGEVLINNSTLSNNAPHALRSTNPTGSIEIYDSNIINNGGGERGGAIYTRGDVAIARSTISGNYAEEYGGAIWAEDNLTITDSILTDNTGIAGGAVYGSVAYIKYGFGTVNITNNCINGNANNVIVVSSYQEIINAENNWWGSMFAPANGKQGSGGTIGNTFIDYEPYYTSPILGCSAPPADTIDQRINLDTDSSIPVVLIIQEGLAPFNFVIDTLPSNGSLSGSGDTWTYTPSPGFIGYDSFTYTLTDGNATNDSGTIFLNVGVEPFATITVDTTSQEVPFIDNGNCTLGEAIEAANTNLAVDGCAAGISDLADIIALSNTTYTFSAVDNDEISSWYGTETGPNALPIIASDIIIDGNGAILERDNGAAQMRFFYVQSLYEDGGRGELTLQNITLQNGDSPYSGGAIFSRGDVILENVNFNNNQAASEGGAIYGSVSSIDSSIFDGNTAQVTGGGAYLYETSISNSVFTNNMVFQTPGGGGGGLYLRGDSIISDTLIETNYSAHYGGGIYFRGNGGSLTLTNVLILDNTADNAGGGIYELTLGSSRNTLNIHNSCIVGNTGGGVGVRTVISADLTNNWWGAHDGPSGFGSGYGDTVSSNDIDYEPFLTSPPIGCPILDPVALDDSYPVLSRSSVDITLSAGGGIAPYSYTVLTQPQHGTLTGVAPDLSYSPDNGYLGIDSFTFEVMDSVGGVSNSGSINLTISTDLEATSQNIEVSHETAKNITLSATGGTAPYTFAIIASPETVEYGTLSGTAPDITYTPDDGYYGDDFILFEVTDSDGFTSTALIYIDVMREFKISNNMLYYYVTPGVEHYIFPNIRGGSQPYTVDLTTSGNATANYNSGVIYYTMDAAYSGIDTLDVVITDALGEQLFITYTMSSNTPLVLDVQDMHIPYEGSSPIILNVSGGMPPYTSEVINLPTDGTIIETSALNYDYTPSLIYNSHDYVAFRVTDAHGFTVEDYITITIATQLLFHDITQSVNYEHPTRLNVASSGGTEPHSYSVQTPPTNGTLSATFPDELIYTPDAGFTGVDTFELRVIDDFGVIKTALYTLTVNPPTNVSDVNGLIAALQNAYDTQEATTINLAPGTYTLTQINNTTFQGENGLPPIVQNVVINGNGATIIRDDTSGENFRFFEVQIDGFLTLRDLTLEKGEIWNASYGGGAIINYGELTVENTHFVNNGTSSSSPGGAITTRSLGITYGAGNVNIIDSTFTGNRANNGGAIYATNSSNEVMSVTIANTIFDNNFAYSYGGALHLSGLATSVSLSDGTLSNNVTQGNTNDNGGAIYISDATLNVNASDFDNNSASFGDAIYVASKAHVNVSASNFTNHSDETIRNRNGRLTIVDSVFVDNTSGVQAWQDSSSTTTTNISNSCFFNHTDYAVSGTTDRISARNNWWGAHDGPSGIGTGFGEIVLNDVDFEPFLTTPPHNCQAHDPVVQAQTVDVETGQATEISFTVDGGLPPFTFSNISAPLHGTIIGDASDGVFEYLSDVAYLGADSISFDVTDSQGGTASGVLDIIVRPALIDEVQTISIPMDTPMEINLVSDTGVPPFTILGAGNATNSEVLWESGDTVYYIPGIDFTGTGSFTYQLQDATGQIATHTMQVTTTARPAATIIVDSTLLENPLTNNGNCTLLEALTAAQENIAYDLCPAGSDTQTDIVYIPAGTYYLDRIGNAGDDVIVRGAGINQTIIEPLLEDAKHSLFYVNRWQTATYELMTIRNGGGLNNTHGSAFYNEGDLTINRIAAENNVARTYGGVVYMPDEHNPAYPAQFKSYNSIFLNNESSFDYGNVAYGRTDTEIIMINNVFQHTPSSPRRYEDLRGPDVTGIHNCFLASQQFDNRINFDLRFNWGEGTLQLTTPPAICDAIELLIPVSISGQITSFEVSVPGAVLVGFEDVATGTITGVTCASGGGLYTFDSTTIEPPKTELIIYAGGLDDPSTSCDDAAAGYFHREWFDNVFDAGSATIVDLTTVNHITGIDFQLTRRVGTPPQPHTVRPVEIIGDTTPDITWRVTSYSSSYEIHLVGPPAFGEMTYILNDYDACDMDTDVCTLPGTTFNPPLPPGDYDLRVRGITPTNILGAWSTLAEFAIALPPQPLLTDPAGIITNSTPTISWLVDAGADSYEISLVGDTYSNVWTVQRTVCIARGCDTPVPDPLPPGDYSLMVRGQNGLGFGNWSPVLTFTVKINSPLDLTVNAIASESEIVAGTNLNFDLTVQNLGPNHANGLTLNYALPSGFNFVSDTIGACSQSASTVTCNLFGLQASNQINFSIQVATDGVISNGVYANEFSVSSYEIDTNSSNNSSSVDVTIIPLPATPTALTTTAISETSIQLDWSDNAGDESEYRVEKQNAQDIWGEIATLAADSITFTDTSLSCDTAHLYRVRAYRAADDSFSQYSNEVNGLTILCPPTGLTAVVDSNNNVQLDYLLNTVSATDVIIERSLDGINFSEIATVATTPPQYVDTSFVCETLYYYRVALYRSGDNTNSNYSNVVSIQTGICPPTNDDFTSASSIVSLPFSDVQQHGGASNEAEDPIPLCNPVNNNSVWYQFTPSQNGNYHFNSRGSEFDVTLSIWTWTGVFNPVACDKDGAIDGQASLTRALTSGTNYFIMLSGNNDVGANATLNVERLADPTPTPLPTLAPLPTAIPPAVTTTIGLFNPDTNFWQFRNTNASGNIDITFSWGTGTNNQPLIGDWDGDNVDGISLYRNGTFIFRNLTNEGSIDNTSNFGPVEAGWKAIAGDWNGDGRDSIGIYKDGQFMLSDDNSTIHYIFSFGPAQAGWIPLAGDWNGNGLDTVGLYKDGTWLLSNNTLNSEIYAQISYGPMNNPVWKPVVGDWNADHMTTIGLYGSGSWRLRTADSFSGTELALNFGSTGNWIPLSSYRGGISTLNSLAASASVSNVTPIRQATPTVLPPPTATLPVVEVSPEPETTQEAP